MKIIPLNQIIGNKVKTLTGIRRKQIVTPYLKASSSLSGVKLSKNKDKSKKKNDSSILKHRIHKSIFKPKHTLISHGRVYNICKTCPSYFRKRLKLLK